jgi:hypothetical protein
MIVRVKRFSDNGKKTIGVCHVDGQVECFVVEDTHRDVKVAGETRIPAGTYKLAWQKTVTPMTEKYRAKYDWFRYHLHILNVPNFEGVYQHVGNDETNSEGCQLMNGTCNLYDYVASDSVRAYKRYYTKVGSALNAGQDVTIIIEDES